MEQAFFVRRIIWASLLASTFIYLFILRTIPQPPAPENGTVMLIALAVVALMCAIASFVVPRIVGRGGLRGLGLRVVPAPSFGDLPGGTTVFEDAASARQRALGVLQTSFILALALREAIAIYGLVLGFQGHPLPEYIGFFVVAWLLMGLGYPTQAADDAELEAAYGAKLV